MADNRTAKSNPVVISGTPLEVKSVPADNSSTWKAGEFGYYLANGLAAVCSTDATNVDFQFLKDQAAATADNVWVGEIAADDTRFEGFVSAESNGNTVDAAAAQSLVGNDYGLKVGSNYWTVETSETTNVAVTVRDIRGNYSPLTDTVSTSPGRVTFTFKSTVANQA